MSEKHTCDGAVYGAFRHMRCGLTAKYERGGKWYCGTHDPVRVAEKGAARRAKWSAQFDAATRAAAEKRDALAEQSRRAACYSEMLAALRDVECALSLMQSYGHCQGDADYGRDAAQQRAVNALAVVSAAISKATGEKA